MTPLIHLGEGNQSNLVSLSCDSSQPHLVEPMTLNLSHSYFRIGLVVSRSWFGSTGFYRRWSGSNVSRFVRLNNQ